ncbi:transposase, partial [candidate division WOR-3 bacterium]|nr:transposase [candidate division WOR-3 bacterium]
RKLDTIYPFVWVDALYEKIRDNGHVISMAVLVVHGVNSSGKREILAIEPMYQETEDNWRLIFKNIKDRGVKKVCYIASDAHEEIQTAVKKEFLGCSWQRCKVHS